MYMYVQGTGNVICAFMLIWGCDTFMEKVQNVPVYVYLIPCRVEVCVYNIVQVIAVELYCLTRTKCMTDFLLVCFNLA